VRKLLMTIVIMAAAVGLIVLASVANRSDAMPLGDPSGIRAALDDLNMIDKFQYYWGGRRYCWYNDGWNGPGWSSDWAMKVG